MNTVNVCGLSSFNIEACVVLCQLAPSNRGGALSDAEALSQITKGHDTMCVMLSSRHKNLETVQTVWAREDIKVGSVFQVQQPMRAQLQRHSTDVVSRPQRTLDAAVSMNDLSIVVDILNIINLQP